MSDPNLRRSDLQGYDGGVFAHISGLDRKSIAVKDIDISMCESFALLLGKVYDTRGDDHDGHGELYIALID